MKMRSFLPAIIFPYTIPPVILCIADGTIIERYFNNNVYSFLFLFLLLWVSAFLFTLPAAKRAVRQEYSAAALLKATLVIKLIHLPVYLGLCLFCLPFLLTAFFFLLVPLTGMGILASILTGLIGRAAVLRGEAEGFFTRRDVDIHGVLLFLFGFDIYSIIVLRRKLIAQTGETGKSEN